MNSKLLVSLRRMHYYFDHTTWPSTFLPVYDFKADVSQIIAFWMYSDLPYRKVARLLLSEATYQIIAYN